MEHPFKDSIDILGTTYTIEVKKKDEDLGFKGKPDAWGFMSYPEKRIVINDRLAQLAEAEMNSEDDQKAMIYLMKKTLRHEIVHAMLMESGLDHNSSPSGRWAKNEEMVDWIAMQADKLIKAWTEAGAL